MKKLGIYILFSFLLWNCERKETFSDIKINPELAIIWKSEGSDQITTEFEAWQKEQKITLDEAYLVYRKFLKNKAADDIPKRLAYLAYAYDKYYVFSTEYNIRKRLDFNLTGVWVNGQNKEAQYMQISPEENFRIKNFWFPYWGHLHIPDSIIQAALKEE
ncbi:MAG: hypothetical protein OIF50_10370 [Flavobacteriaceae bacterium]|nr:hypothetical protein [Flavobacteriaceae bacterium]